MNKKIYDKLMAVYVFCMGYEKTDAFMIEGMIQSANVNLSCAMEFLKLQGYVVKN